MCKSVIVPIYSNFWSVVFQFLHRETNTDKLKIISASLSTDGTQTKMFVNVDKNTPLIDTSVHAHLT